MGKPFGDILELTKRIRKLKVAEIAVSIWLIPEVKQFIIRLNRVEQLYLEGVDVKGQVIGTYTYLTALMAGENSYIFNGIVSHKNVGEPYTLYDSGVFYESFNIIVQNDGFIITANTSKPDGDLLRFGEILGLTQQSKDELSKKMLDFVIEKVRKQILR